MAITKTNFINFSRCPRYVALSEIKKDKLNADITYEEYLEEELEYKLKDVLSNMYEEDEDLIDVVNPQLEVMMKYYKEVEILAGKKVSKIFSNKTTYGESTFSQKSFEFQNGFFKYLCYVDIYNEDKNVIEVKATTSKKFLDLVGGKEKVSIFYKSGEIYKLKNFNKDDMDEKTYNKLISKLKDKYSTVGKYVYDLSVQRFFAENSNNKDMKYYLAVLNHEYVFDGNYIDNKPDYKDDIISIFDFTDITYSMLETIKEDMLKIEKYLLTMDASECKLGDYCEYKKPTECKFKKVCFSMIPKSNSSLNYMNNGFGFKDENGVVYKKLDLINNKYINMLDVPIEWIKNPNHIIQRDALENNTPYINKEKIKLALNELKYPIYHLDFETFPCPLPRFYNEKCYSQSVFQFSLHIEREENKCDKDKDHYEYLSNDFNKDIRKEIAEKLCEYIDPSKGTLFAQNVSFEKNIIKTLSETFPEYKEKLNKMLDIAYDLLYIVRGNTKFYLENNYSEVESKIVNYYHKDLSGSYSLKKTLSVFSNLKYEDLDVKNGVEALVTYASFLKMSKKEFEIKFKSLLEYCKMDTYAMVAILQRLRELVM